MSLIFYLQFYISSTFFIFLNLFYCFCYDLKDIKTNYLIQHNNKNSIMKIYSKTFNLSIFNILVSNLIFFLFYSYLVKYFNLPYNFKFKNIHILIIYKLFLDIPVFLLHKLFHTKLFYKYHKFHHQISKPISLVSFYYHPFDYFCEILFPIFIPLLFLNIDYFSIHLWIIYYFHYIIFETHSGYKNLSEFHDYHHKNPKYNFGTGLFMDFLFKTKKE